MIRVAPRGSSRPEGPGPPAAAAKFAPARGPRRTAASPPVIRDAPRSASRRPGALCRRAVPRRALRSVPASLGDLRCRKSPRTPGRGAGPTRWQAETFLRILRPAPADPRGGAGGPSHFSEGRINQRRRRRAGSGVALSRSVRGGSTTAASPAPPARGARGRGGHARARRRRRTPVTRNTAVEPAAPPTPPTQQQQQEQPPRPRQQ